MEPQQPRIILRVKSPRRQRRIRGCEKIHAVQTHRQCRGVVGQESPQKFVLSSNEENRGGKEHEQNVNREDPEENDEEENEGNDVEVSSADGEDELNRVIEGIEDFDRGASCSRKNGNIFFILLFFCFAIGFIVVVVVVLIVVIFIIFG